MNKLKSILLVFCMLIVNGHIYAQKYANEFVNRQRNNSKKEIVYFKGAENLIRTDINKLYQANDSVIIAVFNKEITDEMSFYGLNVIQTDTFRDSLAENEHTLEISQLEIEEYNLYDSITDEDNSALKFYKELSGVRFNVWLTYDGKQRDENLVFYNSNEIRDFMEGYFEDDDEGNVFINYDITEINPNDLYMIVTYNADTCAKYFFNFLLNRYVWQKTNGEDKNYYGITKQRSVKTKKYPFDCFETTE